MDIFIYGRPGCMGCRAAKRMLTKRDIPYTEIDIDSPEAEEVKNSGATSLPVLQLKDDQGGVVEEHSGFSPEKLTHMIDTMNK